jgi:stage V sporulation protein SpoVS
VGVQYEYQQGKARENKMNVFSIVTGTLVHHTTAEIVTTRQVGAQAICSKRIIRGYVTAEGTEEVTCPKCIRHAKQTN